ncbi:hypothetical protein HBIAX_03833 [Achromobacter xylosoxidans]|nr:hypothetical protein HBIAX_03833 [Achromobacter xylosoxidans]
MQTHPGPLKHNFLSVHTIIHNHRYPPGDRK